MPEEPDVRPEDALEVAQRALRRVADLEERVAELEAESEGSTGGSPDYDDRDTAVIEHLEPGETVPIKRLHKLYRAHTDIRAGETLKQRVQGLVAGPDFRIARAGEIVYDPEGGEQR